MARRVTERLAPVVAAVISSLVSYMLITWVVIRPDSGGALAVAAVLSASVGVNVGLSIALLRRRRPERHSAR